MHKKIWTSYKIFINLQPRLQKFGIQSEDLCKISYNSWNDTVKTFRAIMFDTTNGLVKSDGMFTSGGNKQWAIRQLVFPEFHHIKLKGRLSVAIRTLNGQIVFCSTWCTEYTSKWSVFCRWATRAFCIRFWQHDQTGRIEKLLANERIHLQFRSTYEPMVQKTIAGRAWSSAVLQPSTPGEALCFLLSTAFLRHSSVSKGKEIGTAFFFRHHESLRVQVQKEYAPCSPKKLDSTGRTGRKLRPEHHLDGRHLSRSQ